MKLYITLFNFSHHPHPDVKFWTSKEEALQFLKRVQETSPQDTSLAIREIEIELITKPIELGDMT